MKCSLMRQAQLRGLKVFAGKMVGFALIAVRYGQHAQKKIPPYRCKYCHMHFSCRTGAIMQSAKLPVKKWLYAMYLISVSRKSVSSRQLARELGIAQEAAWRLGHKIRAAWNQGGFFAVTGPVEDDETYIGGKEKNRHAKKKLKAGRCQVGKKPIVGVRDRATGQVSAEVIDKTDTQTLQSFVENRTADDAIIYADESSSYKGTKRAHEAVNHSSGEYVRDDVSTNGMEAFWAVFERGYVGTFHYMSETHLKRYVDEFQARNNLPHNAVDFMTCSAVKFDERLLTHRQLVGGVQ